MIEKLYEKYLAECSNNSILEAVAFEIFKEKICDKLSDMNIIVIDNGVDEQGVLYYSLWSNDGIQTCHVPVYGYYASSEKTLSKLFCKLSDTVICSGDTKFQINLYAHDYEALALFSMMQFGYIYEQGRLEITDYPCQFNGTYTIKTLEKDEIEKRWDEIWTLTDAIIKHLKQAPILYPDKTIIQKDTCTQMFIAALFTITKTWKQPECPSTDEWIKKMWYTGNGTLLSWRKE